MIILDSLDVKWEDESDDAEDEGMENVEQSGYKGINLTFPLKRSDLELLIDTFRKRKVSLRYRLIQ